MIKHRIRFLIYLQFTIEIIVTVLSLAAAYELRRVVGSSQGAGPFVFRPGLLVLIVPLWTVLFHYFRVYRYLREHHEREAFLTMLKALSMGGICLFAVFALLKVDVSRMLVGLFIAINLMALMVERWLFLQYFRFRRRRSAQNRNVIIVGTNKRGLALFHMIRSHREWGMRVIGFVNSWPGQAWPDPEGVPVIGTLDEIERILCLHQIDEVIFVVPRKMIDQVESAVLLCQKMGIQFRIAADFFEHNPGRMSVDQAYDWPFIRFEPTNHPIEGLVLKRAFDIAFSAVVLVAMFPLFALIAALIKMTSPGPVFFVQERCGLNRRRFRMIKFRTMVADAEAVQARFIGMNEVAGPVFKITNDPRLTPVGRVLRKYSLDELPQFINVLFGDMSVVGPRPPIPAEVEKYDHLQLRRLSVRPGLSCIWQVSGRNDTSFDHWMKLDLEYIDRWSFWLDLKLVAKTIPAMLRGTGR